MISGERVYTNAVMSDDKTFSWRWYGTYNNDYNEMNFIINAVPMNIQD